MANNSRSNYKWYILTLATLTFAFTAGAERMCLPVLFKEISEGLGLSLLEIGTIWGMDPLAGVFIALVGGLLVDRFGLKRTLTVACILVGILGALRGLSVNFVSMAAIMFIFGLFSAMMPSLVPKATAVWFSGQQLGLANGILTAGLTVGSMIATMISATFLSPLLGGWRNVLFLYGMPPIMIGLLWFLTGREPNVSESSLTTATAITFRQALSHVVRIKEIWIIGLIMMGQAGAFMGLTGYLPMYLRDVGWTPTSADSAITVFSGVSTISIIPITLLSDRLGSRKWILAPTLLIAAICLGLLPIARGNTLWLLIIIYGLSIGGMMPLFTTLVMETKGVGMAYAGTAIGIVYTLNMLWSFISPVIGNSLGSIHPGLPFILWAAVSVVALSGFYFVKETGQRRKAT